jgi:hypothetical protein
VERHFALLYGDQRGWCSFLIIDGDPDDRDAQKWEEWCFYHGEPTGCVEMFSRLVEQYGGVYTRTALFRERSSKESNALPLRAVLVEDYRGGADLPCSWLIMTSQGSAHGYWLLDEALSVEEYKPIARAMAKKLNADPSGACVKPTRPPGSINRKSERNNYRAKLKVNTSATEAYTAEQLSETFGVQAETTTTTAPGITELSDAECATIWQAMQNDIARIDTTFGGMYINDHGIPRRIAKSDSKTAQEARHILKNNNTKKGTYFHPDGTRDHSRERYRVIFALIANGAPDIEVAAVARVIANFGETIKGAANIEGDIPRSIVKVRRDLPGVKINPMRSPGRPHNEPAKTWVSVADFAARAPEPAPALTKRGRPTVYTLTEDDLVQWLHDNGHGANSTVFGSRKEHAEQLRVSESYLCRLERSLKRQGRAERHTKRHESWLQLANFRVCKNAEKDTVRGCKNNIEAEPIENSAEHTFPIATANDDEIRVYKNVVSPTAEPEGAASPVTTAENGAETACVEPVQNEMQESAELSIAIAENDAETHNARNTNRISQTPPLSTRGECDIQNQEPAQPETTSTLRLREPASVIERRERKARLAKLNYAELEQRRHDLLNQARMARKPWERKELEAQAREVEAELGNRREQGIEAMFALADKQEAEGENQQAQPASAKRTSSPASRKQGEAEHDFDALVASALPEGWQEAETLSPHVLQAQRSAGGQRTRVVPRTTEGIELLLLDIEQRERKAERIEANTA